jgi:DNA adenine methylase
MSFLSSIEVENLHIEQSSFEDFIPKHTDKWMYVDPPYYIPYRLYGDPAQGPQTKSFDHELLHRTLQLHPSWVLSYNDCPYIRELYVGHEIIKVPLRSNMCKNTPLDEILIFSRSPDIRRYHPVV